MKQKNKGIGNLDQIKTELERRLITMRYSKVTIGAHMRIFGWMEEFLKAHNMNDYSKEAGQRFLAEYALQSKHTPSQFKTSRLVVRRLDEILENKLFTPCFRKTKLECPTRFTDWLDKYLESLMKRGFRKTTLASHKRYAGQLLVHLPDTVKTLKKLAAADLYDVFTKYEWPYVVFFAARGFLTFLFETGETEADLSVCVPRPKVPRTLPSIYSGDEIAKLLSAVDRSTSLGKRDYAIIMLASHLGLRSSDIVNLSFRDVDYVAKTIDIVQVKTERPLTLVLNSNVEEAIVDYIHNGRPQSASDKIFLGSQAPYSPLTAGAGYAVANKYFKQAGIAGLGRRQGTHALRMSYATSLIEKDIPYAIVQEALGHSDPESAKYYVRVDVKRLRTCALDVPKPTGAFAAMLGDLEGVL